MCIRRHDPSDSSSTVGNMLPALSAAKPGVVDRGKKYTVSYWQNAKKVDIWHATNSHFVHFYENCMALLLTYSSGALTQIGSKIGANVTLVIENKKISPEL